MVGGGFLLFAAAAQAQPTAPVSEWSCSLVAPMGEQVSFSVIDWDEVGNLKGLIGTEGSVWPSRTLVGRREGLSYRFGGSDDVTLEVEQGASGEARPATVTRTVGGRARLPVAYGFCVPLERRPMIDRALDPAADPADVGSAIPAFDPSAWVRDDCALMMRDGRRLRIDYHATGPENVQLASDDLWPDQRLRARRTPLRTGRARARFGRSNGPSGEDTLFLDPGASAAVRLVHFERFGTEGALDQPGYAICGIGRIVRLPVRS